MSRFTSSPYIPYLPLTHPSNISQSPQTNSLMPPSSQFGAGSRACIGTTIAKIEIYKLICELCRHFDFRLADPSKVWRYSGAWVTKQTDMEMIFTERKLG